jgi:hypothetical protein
MLDGPTGIGVYIRGLQEKIHGTPKQAAKKARDHGVSFVVILACWQDMMRGTKIVRTLRSNHSSFSRKTRLNAYVSAFTEKGIDVWLWGYPWGGHEDSFVRAMKDATLFCNGQIKGWLLDPEIGYKWSRRTIMTRTEQAQKLMNLTLDAMDESLGLGITSYGVAKGHPNFPWNIFSQYGFGSPQLYNLNNIMIKRGLEQWKKHGWSHLAPSVQAFGAKDEEKLDGYLGLFNKLDRPPSEAFIFWSWRQLSNLEWHTIKKWSVYFEPLCI